MTKRRADHTMEPCRQPVIRSNQGTSLNLDVADRHENLSQAAEPRTAEPGAAIFVWGGWAVMTAVAVSVRRELRAQPAALG